MFEINLTPLEVNIFLLFCALNILMLYSVGLECVKVYRKLKLNIISKKPFFLRLIFCLIIIIGFYMAWISDFGRVFIYAQILLIPFSGICIIRKLNSSEYQPTKEKGVEK